MVDVSILLMMGTVSWVYTSVKTSQIGPLKYAQFIVSRLYLSKAVEKSKKLKIQFNLL